ncbi:hypothetical protein SDC9_117060 [bioreactor metagenome]|uniref:Zinc-ribbon domain-containing protein n=1 Tax=bioreactor metagenome TaxID=1076179 RepID=A0A645BYB4_9ZZZZ
MNCPRCGTENREGNTYCRNCDARLTDFAMTSDPTDSSPGNPNSWKVGGIVAICIVVVIVLFFGPFQNTKITRDNIDIDAMYNTNLGVGIRLLMPKSEIEKILGEPDSTVDGYKYGHGADRISITYLDGKAVDIYTCEKNWIVHKGIGIGSTQAEVIHAFGENYFTTGDPQVFYFYDKHKNSISDSEIVQSGKGVNYVVELGFNGFHGNLTDVGISTYDFL